MIMSPNLRKFTLTTHVTSSVGLLGSIAAFLVLAIAGLISQETQTIRATYLAMDLIARFIIVPLAFASLLTGIIQSLGTPWGLFRHYWVFAKLLLTAFATTILLIKLRMIGYAAHLTSETILPLADLKRTGLELTFHAAAGLLVLLVPTVLSVYKPRGLTPYGQSKLQHPRRPQQRPPLTAVEDSSVLPTGVITVSLRRTQVLGLVASVLVVHVLVLHLAGAGHFVH